MILDVKQALSAYTAVRQEHVSTVTALQTGGGAIATAGAIVAGAGLAMAGGLVAATMAAAEFERKLDFFGAVSDATVDQMEAIRQKALQIGQDTIYSADQIADSFTDLAKAGVGVEDLLAGIGEAVANLGAATDMPLAEAATSLTTILNTFSISAEGAVNVVDKLAGAANASSIDVQDLITTMTYAGASAKTAGISFEDVNAAIALLGERGIKGSKAGTGLRQMFDKLLAPTKKGSKALAELGIILDDGTNKLISAQGGLKPIPELLTILNDSLSGLSTSEKMDILGQIFPITSLPTILNLLDAGADGIARITEEINKTTALDVASKRLDNLSGDIEILRGNLETLSINAGGSFQSFARGIVQGITQIVQWFMDLNPQVQTAILYTIAIVSALLILIGTLGVFAGSLLNIIGLAIRMSDAFGALRKIAKALAPIIRFLMLSFLPGPLGPILVILTLISAALAYFFTQTEQGQAIWSQLMALFQQGVAMVLPLLQQFAGILSGWLASALQVILPILVAIGDFLMTILAPLLPIITQGLQGLAEAFSGIGTNSTGISGIIDIVGQLVPAIAQAIPIVIQTLVSLVTTIITTLVGLAVELVPVGLQLVLSLLEGIVQALPTIIPAVINGVMTLVLALIGMLPMFVQAAVTLLQGLIQGIALVLPMLLAAGIQLVVAIITGLVGAIPILVEAFVQLLQMLVLAFPQILPPLVEGVLLLITQLIDAMITMLPVLLEAAITLFMALIEAVFEIAPLLITTLIELIPVLVGALISMIPVILDGAIQLFTGIIDALPRILPALINGVIGLIPKIVSALISMIPKLIEAGIKLFMAIVQAIPKIIPQLVGALINLGTQMIQGLIKGVMNMAKAVVDSVMNVVGGAIDFVKGFLGIHSPSRLMEGFGVNTILGLIEGIHNERRALVREMMGVASDLTSFYDTVGAAAALDASLNVGTALGVEAPSLQSQLAALSTQLGTIAEKDTFNIENLEINNPEPEPSSESLPNAVRKLSYMVG